MPKRDLSRKIPGGKLLKLSVRFGATIETLSIHGDFFLHPEETILLIESALLGMPARSAPDDFRHAIDGVLSANNAQFLGMTSADLADTLSEALQ
jgi:hypothetical protein